MQTLQNECMEGKQKKKLLVQVNREAARQLLADLPICSLPSSDRTGLLPLHHSEELCCQQCPGQSRWAFVAGICSTILSRGPASPRPTSGAIKHTSIRKATLETLLWRIHIQLNSRMCHCTNFLVQSGFTQVRFRLVFNDSGRSMHITACTSSG